MLWSTTYRLPFFPRLHRTSFSFRLLIIPSLSLSVAITLMQAFILKTCWKTSLLPSSIAANNWFTNFFPTSDKAGHYSLHKTNIGFTSADSGQSTFISFVESVSPISGIQDSKQALLEVDYINNSPQIIFKKSYKSEKQLLVNKIQSNAMLFSPLWTQQERSIQWLRELMF